MKSDAIGGQGDLARRRSGRDARHYEAERLAWEGQSRRGGHLDVFFGGEANSAIARSAVDVEEEGEEGA